MNPPGRPRLLIVDDDESNRDMLSRRLARRGFATATAASCEEALNLIRAGSFDTVLLDVQMPGMSGLEALTVIRRERPSGVLPVIMVTAKDRSEDVVEALTLGANDFITKPVDLPVALARIRTQLQRKDAEDRLRESEERYAVAMAGANDGLWDWNLVTDDIYYSPRWKTLFGYDDDVAAAGLDEWFGRVHDADLDRLQGHISEHVAGDSSHLEVEYRMRSGSGAYRWVLTRGLAVRNAEGRAVRLAGSCTDVTKGKVADALTALPNRVLFMDRLGSCIEQARRRPGSCFAVLFIDIDGFKVINDSLGHIVGDELLVAVARRLEMAVRAVEPPTPDPREGVLDDDASTLARFGGDEFTVVIPRVRDVEDAIRVAESILAAFRQPFVLGQRDAYVSASIGVVVSADGALAAQDVLRDADTALYRAKALGKARYEVFDAAMRQRAVARLEMETALHRALERDELRLHYQPVVRLDTDLLVGFEALLRWEHPEQGLLTPASFIPLAEEAGIIVPLGRWVIREACRQLAAWRVEGHAVDRLCVSVNLSSREFQQADLVDFVRATLAERGLTGDQLEIEITESTAMENADVVAPRLAELKASGVVLSIDDFGAGYSSLAYLHRFPIDKLKIDQSFVGRMLEHRDDDGTPIVTAILALARHIGIEVVAEGVENRAQRDRLRALRCQLGQGYFFSCPAPAAEAIALWREGALLSGSDNGLLGHPA